MRLITLRSEWLSEILKNLVHDIVETMNIRFRYMTAGVLQALWYEDNPPTDSKGHESTNIVLNWTLATMKAEVGNR